MLFLSCIKRLHTPIDLSPFCMKLRRELYQNFIVIFIPYAYMFLGYWILVYSIDNT